jgi:membrane-associated phospholipid phosphatase
VIHDTVKVFTSPARWHAKQWGLFSLEVAGVGALAFADDEIRTAVLNHHSPIGDRIAKIDEPFGTWASFVVLAGFFTGGAIAGDPKARGVAVDGLTASFIASGLIVPVLKKIAGRSRPREGYGPYNFFQGGASFPSGHVTQAFTVATVIATEYPSRWVQAACYGPAALVAYARMRHDAHWASDVAASVFIGFGVGRAVARLNLPPRLGDKHVRFVPDITPEGPGVAVAVMF